MNNRNYARGTWVLTQQPWGAFVKARAFCPDGKLRVVQLALTGDTFFSVPARLSYRGKSVCGFISWKSEDGLSTNPEQWVAFTPTGKHRDIFAHAEACLKAGLSIDTPAEVLADYQKETA